MHAWLKKPLFESHFQEPMGSFLRDLQPYSVDIAARSGDPGDRVSNLRVVLPRFTIARLIPE